MQYYVIFGSQYIPIISKVVIVRILRVNLSLPLSISVIACRPAFNQLTNFKLILHIKLYIILFCVKYIISPTSSSDMPVP